MPGRQCEYDFKNHLSRVTLADGTLVQFDYDYRGNRVRRRDTRQGATVETIYIGRVLEFRGGLRIELRHARPASASPSGRAAARAGSTATRSATPTTSATKPARRSHASPTTPSGQSAAARARRCCGCSRLHDIDDATGLVYMGHRWYAPEIGRFVTPDPLYLLQPEKSDGDPAPLQLYSYVGNNPVNQVDPEACRSGAWSARSSA